MMIFQNKTSFALMMVIMLLGTTHAETDAASCGNGVSCPAGQCCNSGKCGNEEAFCGVGCQSEFSDACYPDDYMRFSTSTDGTCGKISKNHGKLCPQGQCCSYWGYCGNEEQHCGAGCQKSYSFKNYDTSCKADVKTRTSTDGTCGPATDGSSIVCPGSQCCSQHGYCGTTDQHCGTGCNKLFGKCQ
ncbi:hypothetical protein MP228_000429 [Amoeboaphelidium protococcarum]|nr:hypothetical protein MP228_000429 [Amoeboaphelidium protococcarum]